MAMLPDYMRTSAAYLGGGVARDIGKAGARMVNKGQQIASSDSSAPIREKVGQFIQSIGEPLQNFAAVVGTKDGMTKRDLGLITQSAALGGAFVGGIGATSGMSALANFYSQDAMNRRSEVGAVGSSPMPQDLQTGYINLNNYGSPIGSMSLANIGNIKGAQMRQRYMNNAFAAALAAGTALAGGAALAGGKRQMGVQK